MSYAPKAIKLLLLIVVLLVSLFVTPTYAQAAVCQFTTIPEKPQFRQPFTLQIDIKKNGLDFNGSVTQFGARNPILFLAGTRTQMNYNASTGIASVQIDNQDQVGLSATPYQLYDASKFCGPGQCTDLCDAKTIVTGYLPDGVCQSIHVTTPSNSLPNIGEDLVATMDTSALPSGQNYRLIVDPGLFGKQWMGNSFPGGSGTVSRTSTARFKAGEHHTVGLLLDTTDALLINESMCSPISFTVQDKTVPGGVNGGTGNNATYTSPDFALCAQAGSPAEKEQCEICFCGSKGCSTNASTTQDVDNKKIWTAFGCIQTSREGIVTSIIRIGMGLAGGFVLLSILYGSFLLTTSSGDPKRVQEGQEMISSAVMGLLFVIFSIIILRFIGVSILQIPGFGT